MKTKAGYETNGDYIKFKSGFTSSWQVETENKMEYFKTENEANLFYQEALKEKDFAEKVDNFRIFIKNKLKK